MNSIHLSNCPYLPCSDNIMIPISNGRFKRISVSEIAYIEASRDNCIINMHDGKKYILVCPMSDFLEQISPCPILRIHRCNYSVCRRSKCFHIEGYKHYAKKAYAFCQCVCQL